MTPPKSPATSSSAETGTAPAQPLPLFYVRPTLLDARAHADVVIPKAMTYDFAAKVTAVPINLVEFPQVAHHYPIAFSRDAAATPVAIVGVREGENLFVDQAGQWAENAYIPAYVRRYPFILSESPDGRQLSLCIDDTPQTMQRGTQDRLFDDKGQPAQPAKNAMEFCRSFHVAAKQTEAFARVLADSGLLVERSAEMTLNNGRRVSFSGFRIVDEEKFNQLSEKTLVEWRDKGWLAGVYAHLFSGLHWGTLTRRINERP
ncbi:MAG: SapC family protein [Rhodospirillales bacterium]|nr:SapC family protein [Alphaproteobacteria bacterium]MCB9986424.1 SapC family protein [Rhodospirillales bacterium]USO07030.1 MAG: SapC family protein [Rhodospirillales bacterium]